MALLLGLALLLSSGAARAECAVWPGEPTPDAGDALGLRWTELRVAELERLAAQWAPFSRGVAATLRTHAVCLAGRAPGEQAGPVRIVQPAIRQGDAAGPPTLDLEAVLVLARPAPAAPPAAPAPPDPAPAAAVAPVALPDASASLEAAQAAYEAARFDDALARAEEALALLAGAPEAQQVRSQRARAGVLAATAALALGREPEARAHFQAALAAEPALALDPAQHSPKVTAVFEAARSGAGR